MNIYIWRSYWKIPFKKRKLIKSSSYLIVHLILTILTVLYFYLFFNGKTDSLFIKSLSYIAGFYIVFLHYSVFLYIIHDLVYKTRNRINYHVNIKKLGKKIFFGGFLIFSISAIIGTLSLYNSERYVIKTYNIDIEKNKTELDHLNIVYISDGHFNTSLNKENIDKVIKSINNISPDILFLGGDFFDEGSTEEDKEIFSKKIASIKTKYGIFAVEGNHEYKSGDNNINNQMKYLEDYKIKVLQDEHYKIPGKMNIIGRKDRQGNIKNLDEVTKDIDNNLFTILLDHRPIIDKNNKNIDLQLSGHMHNGQIFYVEFLNRLASIILNMQIYGYDKFDNLNIIVSSGIGDWGIPVRFFSRREIVNIIVSFN